MEKKEKSRGEENGNIRMSKEISETTFELKRKREKYGRYGERRRCQGNESQIDAGVTTSDHAHTLFSIPFQPPFEACRCLRHAPQ